VAEAQLEKVLGKKAILLITINSIMGTGIFFLPAVGAGVAGPASIISWFVLAIISVYIAMCFGELTSMFPKAGGVYEFCKQAFGHFWSFILGWMTLIAGNITIAMLIVGAIQYLIPSNLTYALPLFGFTISIKILLCFAFLIFFSYVAYRGMRSSKFMLIAFAFVTLGTLVLLIIPGFTRIDSGNFTPFFPLPFSAVFVCIFFIAETFFGWETATFLAAETKNGERVVPQALIWGTVIIGVISLLFVVSSLGVMNWQDFGGSKTPLVDLGVIHYGPFGETMFTWLVFLAIIGSVAGWIVSAPRLILAMAEDKLFISSLAKVHPVHKSPYKAIIFQFLVTSFLVLIASGSYETLLHLLVPLVLLMYSAVLLSLVVLRMKKPELPRPYKAPFGKFGPILTIAFLFSLLVSWILYTHDALNIIKLGLSFVGFGVPVFLLLTFYYNPEIIIRFNNIFAYMNLAFEKLLLPKKIIRDIHNHLDDINGMKVLEFGCGVGTLTKEIIRDVGPNGFIYATDISYTSVRIAKQRMLRRGHTNVWFLHDIHQVNRVHDAIPSVDVVVSFGMLGYIQDIRKVLKEISRLLPEGGKVFFIDYIDLFKVIPNVSWLSDERRLINLFRECGLSVSVRKEKMLLWNYLYVYGIKSESDVPFV